MRNPLFLLAVLFAVSIHADQAPPVGVPAGGSAGQSLIKLSALAGDVAWGFSTLSGTTGSIGGSLLAAGACSSGTVSITGATTAMVATASPAAGVDPSNGGVLGVAIDARVSSAGTVTVSVCSPVAGTPTAATYNVRVLQ